MKLIDAGAQDWSFDGEVLRILTATNELSAVAERLAELGGSKQLEMVLVAENTVSLEEDSPEIAGLEKLIDALEEDEDVDQVFINLE